MRSRTNSWRVFAPWRSSRADISRTGQVAGLEHTGRSVFSNLWAKEKNYWDQWLRALSTQGSQPPVDKAGRPVCFFRARQRSAGQGELTFHSMGSAVFPASSTGRRKIKNTGRPVCFWGPARRHFRSAVKPPAVRFESLEFRRLGLKDDRRNEDREGEETDEVESPAPAAEERLFRNPFDLGAEIHRRLTRPIPWRRRSLPIAPAVRRATGLRPRAAPGASPDRGKIRSRAC
jgi:hypothetical protein